MPEDYDRIGNAQGARRADVIENARAQEFGTNDSDEAGPGKQQHQAQQPPEIGLDDRRENDQQIKDRQPFPDLDEALKAEIDETAEIALDRAGGDADDRGG